MPCTRYTRIPNIPHSYSVVKRLDTLLRCGVLCVIASCNYASVASQEGRQSRDTRADATHTRPPGWPLASAVRRRSAPAALFPPAHRWRSAPGAPPAEALPACHPSHTKGPMRMLLLHHHPLATTRRPPGQARRARTPPRRRCSPPARSVVRRPARLGHPAPEDRGQDPVPGGGRLV
jgi:hypothetical protein